MQRLAKKDLDGLKIGPQSAGKSTACRSAVKRLTLTDFRSYKYLRLDIEADVVVLSGPNGAGKTNVMEALSMLIPGRGLRGAKLSEISRGDANAFNKATLYPCSWSVSARLSGVDIPVNIGTGFQASDGKRIERRTVKIDGEKVRSQAELADVITMYWMTPQMDRLFQDGASSRRRFLDRLVFGWDPAHAGRISAYEQAMRQRLKLLRDQIKPDPFWLSALEETMSARGIAVAAARADVIARLAPMAKQGWGPFPGVVLGLQGEIYDWLTAGPALEAEDRFRATLAADRDRDSCSGRTHSGPQRMDLVAHHAPKDEPASRCSTGEQKALLIALIIANARMRAAENGEAPVLLLDEVAAHLDKDSREALFAGLTGLGGQVWLTGTDPEIFIGLKDKAQFYTIEEGIVRDVSR